MRAVITFRTITYGTLSAASFWLSSCGDTQQTAKTTLEAKDYEFSVGDYLRAAGDGKLDVVTKFTDAGMSVDAEDEHGNSALLTAADRGHGHVVDYLISQGADVNFVGARWDTPLISAARGGDLESVQRLVDAGAKIEAKNEENWSALTAAAFSGSTKVVEFLAPKSKDFLDDALQLAALQGETQVIDLLVREGASVYARSGENKTPLMYASANGHMDAVKLLLRSGANRFALDNEELTASGIADSAGHKDLALLLNEPELLDLEIEADPVQTGAIAQVSEPLHNTAGISGISSISDISVPTIERGSSAAESRIREAVDVSLQSVRLAGANVETAKVAFVPDTPGSAVRMHDYRESNLPVVLDSIDQDHAQIRLIENGISAPVDVAPGELIGDTSLRVVRLEQKFTHSKQGQGALVDVSRMLVEDESTGQKHLVIKDLPAKSSETFAVMSFEGSDALYDVRPNDEFTIGDESTRYRVIDVRPTQVVMENLDSGDTFTVARQAG